MPDTTEAEGSMQQHNKHRTQRLALMPLLLLLGCADD
ncbi:MAG: hypothetical protein ACI8RZ_001156, partial [Myxococcota bacterium]